MNYTFDTICAIATPLSKGGIGVIRVSGENAIEIVQKIFTKKIIPKVINHGWIIDNGEKIDEVIVLPFIAPHSYTGENVAEIQTHGSPVVINHILNMILDKGARLAQRGEFTKRAFLNHKMDLSQAEAVLDLINAKTQKSANSAAGSLCGLLKIKTEEIKSKISSILGKIIASLDFPQDVAEVDYEEIITEVQGAIDEINDILKNAKMHNILRQGIKIAVAGRPNAGKSSLFNTLLNLKRAIVTEIEGTTRDTITETLEINGISATLIDTAGIRDKSPDKVENIGIEQSKAAIEEADIVLCLYDGQIGICEADEKIFNLAQDKKRIIVRTKCDLCNNQTKNNEISISSKTKEGIEELKKAIYEEISDLNPTQSEFLTNQRQQYCLKKSLEALENALNGAKNNELQDLISIDLKASITCLGEISGEVITEDILNDIFMNFCIGK
ncbi:TPA: tRNA uridine-5-carboxymethylaminomethyl(34) synthesis GTPase MnmE [Candidatus Galligastranaerophilus intestinavium]|uniref:tRNA modification GTPase MnmE n=1 Tax=Candidatus Galligastranaerophilus intestinavium TaxID=2840836 RepID=A0A9D1FJX1_9BACT|nr:tRNA uridine-5-carboxymethylaminomethyl(34) synthesis GTPase MnmE [Candidatus Galligastranaerophilus intestinavium]